MGRVAPAPSRVAIHREPGWVRAVARVRRNWLVGPFLLVWLCGWAFGEVAVIRELALRARGGGFGFLLVWLAAWTVGGVLVSLQLLWSFAGREEIAVGPRTLSVRVVAGPLRRTREYDLASVQNVREDHGFAGQLARAFRTTYPGSHGAIAFDYGARTVRIGTDLEGEDVQKVLAMLQEGLPGDGSRF
jgi:hypothetical protein